MKTFSLLITWAALCGIVVADDDKPQAIKGAVIGGLLGKAAQEQDAAAQQIQLQETLEKLKGTEWRLVRMGDKESAINVSTTMSFQPDGKVSGRAGVNRYSGPFKLENGSLKAGPFITTLMGGEPAAMKQESEFMSALATPQTVTLEEGKLVILSACGCGCEGGCEEDACKKCGDKCECKDGCKAKTELVFESVAAK